eukprot:GHVH01006773.1.p1 GENE.GHVH01006773.1~~GHVH01006773.1.p1  ORF type:complete len:810 (+),score=83.93 GHVH01006773.1:156-2585(+)
MFLVDLCVLANGDNLLQNNFLADLRNQVTVQQQNEVPNIVSLPNLPNTGTRASFVIDGQPSVVGVDDPDYVIEIKPFLGTDSSSSLVGGGFSNVLQLPINIQQSDSAISGQVVPGGSLLSLLIPAITNPATINGLMSAGQAGLQGIAALREGKSLKSANDPARIAEPYTPIGLVQEADQQKGGKFRRFLQCQETGQGMCCVMPDFCHPWATCLSETDSLGQSGGVGLVTDIISAVPRCQCRAGFIGDGKKQGTGCVNANECERGESGCQHLCTDLSPGYACSCQPGFRLGLDQMSCKDIDECVEGVSDCQQLCINHEGGFSCECNTGYLLREDGIHCEEIDECVLMKELAELPENRSIPNELYELYPPCPVLDLCTNSEGGYECFCPPGFEISNGTACVDVDECSDELINCPEHSQCLNHPGYFVCLCDAGYSSGGMASEVTSLIPETIDDVGGWSAVHQTLNALHMNREYCSDVDECTLDGVCPFLEGPFAPHCINTAGSYDCRCTPPEDTYEDPDSHVNVHDRWIVEARYFYNVSRGACEQVDICAERACGPDSSCERISGGAVCTCDSGYFMDPESPGCVDIDECKQMLPPLDGQVSLLSVGNTVELFPGGCVGQCLNFPGGYDCDCDNSFIKGEGVGQCKDRDECDEGTCKGACMNFRGGYQCMCPPGFTSRSGVGLGVSSLLVDEEVQWMKSRIRALPLSNDEVIILWKSAVEELLCRPIEDLCNQQLSDGTNIHQSLCGSAQLCINVDAQDVRNFQTLADFMRPLKCQCFPGYHTTRSGEKYPDPIISYLGILSEHKSTQDKW